MDLQASCTEKSFVVSPTTNPLKSAFRSLKHLIYYSQQIKPKFFFFKTTHQNDLVLLPLRHTASPYTQRSQRLPLHLPSPTLNSSLLHEIE